MKDTLKPLGTRTILGKRVKSSEFANVRFYRIGQCNIQASTIDEAIEKYIACKTREAKP